MKRKPLRYRWAERQAAKRYMHMLDHRRCHDRLCLHCWTRTVTGARRRAKRRLIARMDAEAAKVRACDHDWANVETVGGRECPVCPKCHLVKWTPRGAA